jgi:putative membrane protein
LILGCLARYHQQVTILINLAISTAAVLLANYLLPGVQVDSVTTAIAVAIVFGIINAVVKPVLTIITFPLTLVTFGLFMIALNILLVFLTDWIVPGFSIDGWLQALLFGIIVSLVGSFLQRD